MLAHNGRAPNSAEPWSSAHDRRAPKLGLFLYSVLLRKTEYIAIVQERGEEWKGTHAVVKAPLTFVIIVIHENEYNHRVQRETSYKYKEIYILLHFYSQKNE